QRGATTFIHLLEGRRMTRYRSLLAFLVPVLFGLFVPSSPAAQTGPVSLDGTLDGVAYTIKLPEAWNGTLLVFMHGYRDVADAPGEVEDHTAHFEPVSFTPLLLSHGFCIAASAFRVNGYNIQEGIEDTKRLM